MPRKGQRRYKNWLTEGFPGWLQERLEERDWLAVELAEKIGVNSGVISNYMTGARAPEPKMLQRIADVLNVSDEEIFVAAGYLREMTLSDDPRRMELVRRLQAVELTPERYDLLNMLLTTMQGSRPLSTGRGSAAARDPLAHTPDQLDDQRGGSPRSAPPDESTRLDRAG